MIDQCFLWNTFISLFILENSNHPLLTNKRLLIFEAFPYSPRQVGNPSSVSHDMSHHIIICVPLSHFLLLVRVFCKGKECEQLFFISPVPSAV